MSAGQSLDAMLPRDWFHRTGAEVLCLGAGGAAIAIAIHLLAGRGRDDRPRRLVFVDRRRDRLDALAAIVRQVDAAAAVQCVHNEDPAVNDAFVHGLAPGSLVVNATGMGKDTPGSPLTDAARFPAEAVVWELNYRGELDFLHQARAQAEERSLQVHDGWLYFIHGWTAVIEEVFDIRFTASDIAELARIAARDPCARPARRRDPARHPRHAASPPDLPRGRAEALLPRPARAPPHAARVTRRMAAARARRVRGPRGGERGRHPRPERRGLPEARSPAGDRAADPRDHLGVRHRLDVGLGDPRLPPPPRRRTVAPTSLQEAEDICRALAVKATLARARCSRTRTTSAPACSPTSSSASSGGRRSA